MRPLRLASPVNWPGWRLRLLAMDDLGGPLALRLCTDVAALAGHQDRHGEAQALGRYHVAPFFPKPVHRRLAAVALILFCLLMLDGKLVAFGVPARDLDIAEDLACCPDPPIGVCAMLVGDLIVVAHDAVLPQALPKEEALFSAVHIIFGQKIVDLAVDAAASISSMRVLPLAAAVKETTALRECFRQPSCAYRQDAPSSAVSMMQTRGASIGQTISPEH